MTEERERLWHGKGVEAVLRRQDAVFERLDHIVQITGARGAEVAMLCACFAAAGTDYSVFCLDVGADPALQREIRLVLREICFPEVTEEEVKT